MTTSITSLPSASLPLTGTERVPMDQTVGTAIAATALVAGTGYRIEALGTTSWTACGLPAGVAAAVGLTFVATGAGTGTGTAIEVRTVETTTQAIANLAGAAAGTDLSYDPATRLLSSSTGGDVALPLVSPTAAGLLSAAGWLKLDSIVVDRATLTVAPVRNNSGASIAKGTPVIVTGSNGTTKTIAPADASTEATAANTLGLTLDVIANNADGFVVTEGPLSGVNTASLAEGQLIYLSETTGAITSTRPTQPAHGVVLGWCVKSGAGSAGIVYVKVDNGVELDELHDVLISGASTDQALVRANDGLWKNRTIYASTTPAALGTAAVGTSTTLARADHVHAMPSAANVGADPSGTAAAAVAAHVAAADSHPIYTAALANKADLINGFVPASQLPGFVDDVLEFASLAAFPATGETGKIYVSLAPPNRIYRWSGSTYIELVPSPGSTDAVAEGSVNLYFTNTRARAAIGATGSLSYNPTTGVISYTAPTIGTAANNVVALDGAAKLPAVDGSQLTGLVVGDSNIAAAGLSQSSLNGRPVAPFAPFTAYLKGDLASLFGLVYRRKIPGTSGATLDPAMWDLQSAADGSNDCFYTVGKYFNPSIAPTTTGIALGQNTIFLYPFIVRRRVRVNGVQVRVLTAAASTTFQCAIYAASAAKVPTGPALASTTDMSLAAATAVAASISPIWLDPGQIYFRAINVLGSATGVFVAPTSTHPEALNLIGATTAFPSSTVSNLELSLAWGYGNWPDMTGRTATEGNIPRVSLALLVSELG